MQKIIASESRIAKIFKISERGVRDKFKEARVAPGEYDLLEVIEIFIELSNGKDEISEERKVDIELKKLKLKILQEQYHHVDNIKLLVSDMIIRFKSKLNAIPTKASSELLNISNRREIEKILKNMINESLNELSEYEKLRTEDVYYGNDGAEND